MIDIFKKSVMVLSALLILFLIIGSISASENISDDSSLESSDADIVNDVSADDNSNDDIIKESNDNDISEVSILKEGCETDVVSSSSNNDNLSYSNEETVLSSDVSTGSSSVKVVKSSTKVYAPAKVIKYKKDTYFKIKVVDSKKNLVKNVLLKVRVDTGKNYKIYSIKTNSKGVAKLPTKKLSLGTHKVTITTNDKKYVIKKTSKIAIKKSVPKQTKKLNAYAPAKTVVYGVSKYFTITVKDDYDDVVKNVLVKVNVFTGKKYKTYSLKTNSKGEINIQTNKLAVGSHKVTIKNGSKNYKISKSSKIVVNKKSIFSSKIGTTKLISVKFYPKANGDYYAKLVFDSKKNTKYQILRKSTGSYKVLSTVKANSDQTAFFDKIGKDILYTYSVRKIIEYKTKILYGSHDAEGLKLLDSPDVKVDFQNLKAEIQWSNVSDATKYLIFRKVGRSGEFKCIASVDANVSNYTDVYSKSGKDLSIVSSRTFVDPSFNSLFYTVRACNIKDVDNVTKKSHGLYLIDGDFHLEAPSVVSLQNGIITWGKVPNAEGYLIIKKGADDEKWSVVAKATAKSSTSMSLNIGKIDKNAYYSVRAYAYKNGKKVYSNFDKGFSLMNYSSDNSQYRILYFGDSITYGSPYKSNSSRHIFSIPHRVAQLLGCVYFNPSIPGSTYHDLGQTEDGKNVENTDYYRYRITREVVDPIVEGKLPGNWESLDSAKNSEGITNTTLDEYNIVVLAAGTNDYLDNTIIGSSNSTNISTFNGALNYILGKIENASKQRVERNESQIKVVFVDLYYSDRTYDITQRNNRDVTPNKIGLTLMDYQEALDEQLNKWENSSEYLSFYNFNTRDYNISNEENCPYTASDNLHFTKFTYGQYGNAFANFLLENVFDK